MRKQQYFISVLLFFSLVGNAQTWTKTKSANVIFKIKNAGIGVDGKFTDVKATILLDETTIANSKFSGIVKVSSVKTGIGLRDEHLREKEEFFNEEKFPSMELVSNKITATKQAGVYQVEWKLTIKGISKYITTDVIALKSTNEISLSTSFIINRLDWKIGSKSIMMNDKVTVKLNSVVTK
jgi:polyisoprenoid-binding protein YceI